MKKLTGWRKPPFLLAPVFLLPVAVSGVCLAVGADQPAADPDSYEKQIRPVFQQYCYPCHGTQTANAGINLSSFADLVSVQHEPAVWRKVLKQVKEKSMPPPGLPQPSAEQRDKLVSWLTRTLDQPEQAPQNPGRVLIHRLSRTEYNNTIRDLFGVDSRPADRFPADGGGGGGFDNNADTLFIPPILMERYLSAAGEILDQAKPERVFFVRPSSTLSDEAAARRILKYFAARAFRRPVETTEMDRLMQLFTGASRRGSSFEDSLKLSLKAVLISPQFLFRIEKDQGASGPYRITDNELASRLSYFLWSSMPDDELFQLASQNRLHDPAVLDREVWRMLQSPKAAAFADSFAGQWLRVRDLYTTAQPDPERYPEFNASLRDAMYNETVDFVGDVLRTNGSLVQLLDADYTYLNDNLARLYGIDGVKGPEMRRVQLADHRRGGVLTMAGVLAVTSYPQRTSPVLRGKWVLEEILGSPPPPPPPGAGGLSPDDAPRDGMTFRQRLELHRSKPQCASCHSKMDPLGFGLENFDGIGRWRTQIGGTPVDSSGVLEDGQKFSGPEQLKQHLLSKKEEFIHNMVEKMLSYALGRGLESYDAPTVNQITASLASDGYHSATLIREIVKSYPFQNRQNG